MSFFRKIFNKRTDPIDLTRDDSSSDDMDIDTDTNTNQKKETKQSSKPLDEKLKPLKVQTILITILALYRI